MKKRKNLHCGSCLILSLLMIIAQCAFSQTVSLTTKVRLKKSSSCSVAVYKNGKVVKRLLDVKRKCKVELKFDEEYLIVFKQKGVRSKALTVNTKHVPEHMQDELLDFAFEVSLDQPYSRPDDDRKEQLVAHWFYHSNYGEFDYTYDTGELAEHKRLFNESLRNEQSAISSRL